MVLCAPPGSYFSSKMETILSVVTTAIRSEEGEKHTAVTWNERDERNERKGIIRGGGVERG